MVIQVCSVVSFLVVAGINLLFKNQYTPIFSSASAISRYQNCTISPDAAAHLFPFHSHQSKDPFRRILS
jgi:hypothetical protein